MNSVVPYKERGALTKNTKVVYGYNPVSDQFEHCDQGFIQTRTTSKTKKNKKTTEEE